MGEKKITLTIGQDGMVSHDTEKITGHLESFIIDTGTNVVSKLICVLRDYPNVTLLDAKNIAGQQYLPIRSPARAPQTDEVYNYSITKYYLNDVLHFEVMGVMGAKINIVVRFT